jgi:hypothetical protein
VNGDRVVVLCLICGHVQLPRNTLQPCPVCAEREARKALAEEITQVGPAPRSLASELARLSDEDAAFESLYAGKRVLA